MLIERWWHHRLSTANTPLTSRGATVKVVSAAAIVNLNNIHRGASSVDLLTCETAAVCWRAVSTLAFRHVVASFCWHCKRSNPVCVASSYAALSRGGLNCFTLANSFKVLPGDKLYRSHQSNSFVTCLIKTIPGNLTHVYPIKWCRVMVSNTSWAPTQVSTSHPFSQILTQGAPGCLRPGRLHWSGPTLTWNVSHRR